MVAKTRAVKKVSAKPKPPPRARASAVKPGPAARAAKTGKAGAVTEAVNAPEFELEDDAGKRVSSASLAGKPYVLYFYPKDDTPGCTKEACDFRDSLAGFNTKKVRVLGVSPDSPASHVKFKTKYGLTFTLLSDPEKSLARAYGVWAKKINYGREYMGIVRSTFLVDKQGVIKQAWRGVRVPGHIAEVLEHARAL
jgi:thioredoxin-dependent peroxiredoxin